MKSIQFVHWLIIVRDGTVDWEEGTNRKLSLSYTVPTSSSRHSTVTVLTTRIIQVRDYWQTGDANTEPAQLSKDQTETGIFDIFIVNESRVTVPQKRN
jgi:hypothetical protein